MNTMKSELMFVLQRLKEAKNYVPPVFEKEVCGLYMNYSMYGPSLKCKAMLNELDIDRFKEYPYKGNSIVEKAISDSIGISEDKVIVDNGASSILELIFRIVLNEEDTIIYPNPGWDYYRSLSSLMGVKCVQYNLNETANTYRYSRGNIQDCINQWNPKLVVITSPNMPTGNIIFEGDLEVILKENPHLLVLVDEAYFGYSNVTLNIDRLTTEYDNVVFVRTFSKLYGLASERIGFAIANKQVIEVAKKLSPLFGISYVSQMLVKTALEDKNFYETVSKQTIDQREKLKCKLNERGNYSAYESRSNFILIKVNKYDTNDIVEYVRQNGYVIRECGRGYNLKQHIRISIGTEKMTDDLIKIFCEYDTIKDHDSSKLAQVIQEDDSDFDFD